MGKQQFFINELEDNSNFKCYYVLDSYNTCLGVFRSLNLAYYFIEYYLIQIEKIYKEKNIKLQKNEITAKTNVINFGTSDYLDLLYSFIDYNESKNKNDNSKGTDNYKTIFELTEFADFEIQLPLFNSNEITNAYIFHLEKFKDLTNDKETKDSIRKFIESKNAYVYFPEINTLFEKIHQPQTEKVPTSTKIFK